MAERWKAEAGTALVFAAIFMAITTVSLVESYKWLSPDTGSQTVEQLDRISEQLFNSSRGIPLEVVVPISTRAFKPGHSVYLVNVTWFTCAVLCFFCSIAATVAQQCAIRYLLITQRHGTPYARAQIRMSMFNSLETFHVERLLLLVSMGIHLSILLYCVGLVGFVFRVWEDVGFIVLSCFSACLLIYGSLTILPIIRVDCPIATPFTNLAWRLYHFSFLGFFKFIRGTLSAIRLWKPQDVRGSHTPAQWLEERIRRHGRMGWNGLQGTIELRFAEGRPAQVDVRALQDERRFTALVDKILAEDKDIDKDKDKDKDKGKDEVEVEDKDKDKDKVENLVENIAAWVPDFFNAYTPSRFSETSHTLMSNQPSTILNFGSRLHHLLKTCKPGAISNGRKPDEEAKRNKRLQTCLKCLWYWVKAYTGNGNSAVPLPSHFPLPSPDTTRLLQAEKDPAAGMLGRCFGALVAKKLAADVNSPYSDIPSRDAKLESLSAILGIPKEKVRDDLLGHPRAISLANIVTLTSSGMDTLDMLEDPEEKVPPEVLSELAGHIPNDCPDSRYGGLPDFTSCRAATGSGTFIPRQKGQRTGTTGSWMADRATNSDIAGLGVAQGQSA
ncbi:hypothetical protein H4582DRAFT_1307170 [Lactarius indigo]|nr:hypothetical protein H4582DRAFT_1307170 [Lactarius indigo]